MQELRHRVQIKSGDNIIAHIAKIHAEFEQNYIFLESYALLHASR